MIHKYPLNSSYNSGVTNLTLPTGVLLDIQAQGSQVVAWFNIFPKVDAKMNYVFEAVMTGEEPPFRGYFRTVQLGGYVFHYYVDYELQS